jgi:hypothetical protein
MLAPLALPLGDVRRSPARGGRELGTPESLEHLFLARMADLRIDRHLRCDTTRA